VKVAVDRTMCVGHAQCEAICPAVFRTDELGYAVVVGDGAVPAEHEADAREAAESCPEQAISVSDGA
jgi:ferredoxin